MEPKESTARSSSSNRALWITYINIVLYALCYQLQRPVEPFLVEALSKTTQGGATAVTVRYGQLQSFFSTIQTLGSPIVGILLDRVGIRNASTAVFCASAASYAILAAATNMNTLFYSKIPTALQHAFLVAQAVAATSCQGSEAARAQALGRMTTAYTIGATIGPYLGGQILQRTDNLYTGARLAVVGSFLSVVLSLLFLPSVTSTAAAASGSSSSSSSSASKTESSPTRLSLFQELQHAVRIALRPNLWPLLAVKIISGVASSMFQTALPMVLTQQLHFDPATLGLSMSLSMMASAAFGVFGMGRTTRQLGAMGMAQLGLVLRPLLGGLVALLVSYHVVGGGSSGSSVVAQHRQSLVILVSVLHGLASHALATGVTTQTTGNVAPDEQGTLLGLEHGLFSMARIGGPTAGTRLLTVAGLGAVVAAGGAIDVSLLALLVMTASQVVTPAAAAAAGRNSTKTKGP